MADDATPAEVIEVVGSTGMHGEAMQVKCRILDGNNKGRIITRNTVGPIREPNAKQRKCRGGEGRWLNNIPAVSAAFSLNLVLARCMSERTAPSFTSAVPSARTITSSAGFPDGSSGLLQERRLQIRSEIADGPHLYYGEA